MKLYDNGAHEEGERLASCAYILLHDGKHKNVGRC